MRVDPPFSRGFGFVRTGRKQGAVCHAKVNDLTSEGRTARLRAVFSKKRVLLRICGWIFLRHNITR